ncbi:hypothetical protein M9458_021871, partial [Cirrhinus mrigala]
TGLNPKVETLENFIDDYFSRLTNMPQPKKKQPRREYSAESEEDPTTTTIEVGLLESINNKLTILEVLHQDIKDLKSSLDFSQSQIDMRDNLVFSGIQEQTQDNPEQAIKDFMHSALKLPKETVNNITFHRVHRLGSINNKNPDTKRPRPIVAKFEHYKQKELIKSKGKELRGTTFGLNDQFPRIIQDRRRILIPIMKQFRQNGRKAVITVDRLYVDGQLYRNDAISWL